MRISGGLSADGWYLRISKPCDGCAGITTGGDNDTVSVVSGGVATFSAAVESGGFTPAMVAAVPQASAAPVQARIRPRLEASNRLSVSPPVQSAPSEVSRTR